jgi:hypothetical protein
MFSIAASGAEISEIDVTAASLPPSSGPDGIGAAALVRPALPLFLLFLQEIISERVRNPAGNLERRRYCDSKNSG